jgi:3-deoxy-manno-octulosonate cytidylyltransferase (CMP-KDO synthetase)
MKSVSLKVLGVIPARIGSARIARKMLKDIAGKPLIQRTYERTVAAKRLDALIIATDSDDIESAAVSFGARVVRSVASHENGTERTAEAVEFFTDFKPDIIATIWGDEPTYPASVIDRCIEFLIENPSFDAVIPSFKITDQKLVENPSVGKVVSDVHGRILYLSRSPIPYNYTKKDVSYYSASGALVMRKKFLEAYQALPRTGLEAVEDIEQLRMLEAGYSIGTVKTDFLNRGVNTPEDYDAVVQFFANHASV